ncbi:putative CAF1 family ribonuclease [Blattamonas nauphoetae]|uniref:CAF1 family ribonuclease n=1 Tax=Blattamonas nauphoetae TaxID=2049346 RepID=A0ABQ9Y4K9_9EUKA|nr:putative CAF1 family ribonuclease [Blattamonas nauphoetae]
MSSLNIPLIFHNGLSDLVFLFGAFIGPFPSSIQHFSALVHAMFPTIVDTKAVSFFSVQREDEEEPISVPTFLDALFYHAHLQNSLPIDPSATEAVLFDWGFDSSFGLPSPILDSWEVLTRHLMSYLATRHSLFSALSLDNLSSESDPTPFPIVCDFYKRKGRCYNHSNTTASPCPFSHSPFDAAIEEELISNQSSPLWNLFDFHVSDDSSLHLQHRFSPHNPACDAFATAYTYAFYLHTLPQTTMTSLQNILVRGSTRNGKGLNHLLLDSINLPNPFVAHPYTIALMQRKDRDLKTSQAVR